MKEQNKYQPINCGYYDELEALATQGKSVLIQFYNTAGQEQELQAKIITFESRDAAEYLVLDNGVKIRLDRLISVDNKPLQSYC